MPLIPRISATVNVIPYDPNPDIQKIKIKEALTPMLDRVAEKNGIFDAAMDNISYAEACLIAEAYEKGLHSKARDLLLEAATLAGDFQAPHYDYDGEGDYDY